MFSERGRSYVPGSEYLNYLNDILSTNEPKPFTPNLFNLESSLKIKEPHRHFCDAIEAEGYQGKKIYFLYVFVFKKSNLRL